MTSLVPLATGSYVTPDPRASCKRLVGCYSEIQPQTSQADSKSPIPPIAIRRAPGIASFASVAGGLTPVRGISTMAGITFLVIGSGLYVSDALGNLTQIGGPNPIGILGSGFVRIANNGACMTILIPGTYLAYTYSFAGGLQQLTNPGFTQYGAIDVWFCDTFTVFLALGGRDIFTDDGQIVSGQGQITFTTGSVFPREFGNDLFVGMCVDHREVLGFGALSSEGFINVGNAVGSPLGSAPNSFMEVGAHPDTAYCIAKQDQSTFWVANDLTVRRRNGQTPVRVSNSGTEAILATANSDGSLVGSYALTPSIGGHPFWILQMPAIGRSLAYDCLTTEWWEPESLGLGNWRPLCIYNAFGKQLVGDSITSQIGYLDPNTFTEFGQPMFSQITTQSVFDNDNRITHRRLELVITAGAAPTLGTTPLVTLWVSDDSGSTWRARETVSMGFRGQRTARTFWTNLGQSRNRVYRFQFSDPTQAFTVAVIAELDGGKW